MTKRSDVIISVSPWFSVCV